MVKCPIFLNETYCMFLNILKQIKFSYNRDVVILYLKSKFSKITAVCTKIELFVHILLNSKEMPLI